MFYLNQYFFNLGKHPVRGLFFLLFGVIGVLVASQKNLVDSHLEKFVRGPERGSYFYALISSRHSAGELQRKLVSLPGVVKIQILDSQSIEKKAQSLLTAHDLHFQGEFSQVSYFGLKVVLSEKIKARSQQLIRDYLVRLVRDNDVILGNVKSFGPTQKTSQFLTWIRRAGSSLALALAFVFWFFAGMWILGPIKKMAYVVERFQRRCHVAVKTYLVACLMAISAGIGLSLLMGNIQWMGLSMTVIPVGLSFLSAFKNYQWNV